MRNEKKYICFLKIECAKGVIFLSKTTKQRYKLTIRCHKCGEKFILRGTRNNEGKFETGFKRCICGNETDLEIDLTPA